MSEEQATPKRVRVEGVPNLYQRPADKKYEAGYAGTDGKWHIKTLGARNLTEAKAELRQVLEEGGMAELRVQGSVPSR